MTRIGIVGHRFFATEDINRFVYEQCSSVLKILKTSGYNNIVALSAMAEGSDTIFLKAAISLNIPFEIIRPFEQYVQDFTSVFSRNRYLLLQRSATKEIRLPYFHRSEDAYFDAMKWVVTNSHVLIAVWDCKEGRGRGGTSDAIKLAVESNDDWVHIDVTDRSTKFYLKKISISNKSA
ncbi:MAG: hypothetical protein ABI675_17455 [Chitinophagaceae bacterium]